MVLPVEPGPELSAAEVTRYSRHLLLADIGVIGQRRLRAARVLVLGAGGLGSPALLYLAAAGVGTIGIVDDDVVDITNLQRQIVHPTAAVGRSKVASAMATVAAVNPDVTLVAHEVRLDEHNAAGILAGYDVVLDGTDNFPTRYLVNDTCVRLGVPLVWATVLGFAAQVSVFWATADGGVQLRDLFPSPPAPGTVPSCSEAGVVGALCGQVGSIMATEAVKLITGAGRPLVGRVLVIDALAARWDQFELKASTPSGHVPAPQVTAPADGLRAAHPTPAPETGPALVPARGADDLDVDVAPQDTLAPASAADGRDSDPATGSQVLLDVREPAEFAELRLPGSINVPLARILAGDLSALPDGQPLLVVCRSGARAEVAAAALAARGRSASVLPGGVLAVQRQGGRLIGPDATDL